METAERETPLVPPGQGGDKENVSISRAELDGLRRDKEEANESARYWAGIAKTTGNGGGGGEEPAQPGNEELDVEIDPEQFIEPNLATGSLADDSPEKLVEDLAARGVQALKDRGYVSREEAHRIAVEAAGRVATQVARQVVGTERTRNVTDQRLIGAYPDLRNPQSELFKETATIYREAVAMDPSAAKSPGALLLAAKAAKQIIDSRGGGHDGESEEDRRDRIDAQAGDRGRRGQATGDDLIGPEAAEVLRQMGVTAEDFKAERTKLGGQSRTVRRGR